MDSILIPWNDGNGNITVSEVNGEILISSDTNSSVEREQTLTFRTLVGDKTALLLVKQKGERVVLRDVNGFTLRDNVQSILTAKIN